MIRSSFTIPLDESVHLENYLNPVGEFLGYPDAIDLCPPTMQGTTQGATQAENFLDVDASQNKTRLIERTTQAFEVLLTRCAVRPSRREVTRLDTALGLTRVGAAPSASCGCRGVTKQV